MPFVMTFDRIGQDGYKEGFRQGFNQGFEEGFREGYKEGIRAVARIQLETRFQEASRPISETLESIQNIDLLQEIARQLVIGASLEAIRSLIDRSSNNHTSV